MPTPPGDATRARLEQLGATAWATFADVVLQRAGLVARVDRNRPPDPLAGLKVDDDDLDALLRELPGLERLDSPADRAGEVEAGLAELTAEARSELLASVDEHDPFGQVALRAELSEPEIELLAVLCATEIDPRRQRIVGYLNDDVSQRRVTPWTLARLFGSSSVTAAGPSGGLRRAALLSPPTDAPWAVSPLALAPAVLWWLVGDDALLDTDLPPGTMVVAGTERGDDRLVVASGPDRVRRLQAVVDALDAPSCLVSPAPQTEAQWDALIRRSTLAGLGTVIEVDDDLSAEARDRVDRADHLRWGVVSAHDLPVASLPLRPWRQVPVADPAATTLEWAATFPDIPQPPYPLTADQLHQVARSVPALGGDMTSAVRRLAAGQIDTTASRLRPQRGWDDLVLDETRMAQVQEVAMRSRHRRTVFFDWGFDPLPSTGVVALFAGQSGTGKTLAAEIVAGDLGVDLYKIDLANLVSKYIGETEKNLATVFDAAEASRVVLFFDEADALLGKRSEVSDAHDRYANIEVAYLLQRLERYDGVAIMATNLVKNIDAAFLRRIHIMVEFPLPETPERRRIWARSFPPGAPLDADLDLDALAEEAVAGGTIRNAALGAAFHAAEAGTAITTGLTMTALHGEMRKMGRLVADLGRPMGR